MAETRKPSRRPTARSSGGSNGRTIAGLEAELGVVRAELSRVDRENDKLARKLPLARLLIAVTLVFCFYAFLVTTPETHSDPLGRRWRG